MKAFACTEDQLEERPAIGSFAELGREKESIQFQLNQAARLNCLAWNQNAPFSVAG